MRTDLKGSRKEQPITTAELYPCHIRDQVFRQQQPTTKTLTSRPSPTLSLRLFALFVDRLAGNSDCNTSFLDRREERR